MLCRLTSSATTLAIHFYPPSPTIYPHIRRGTHCLRYLSSAWSQECLSLPISPSYSMGSANFLQKSYAKSLMTTGQCSKLKLSLLRDTRNGRGESSTASSSLNCAVPKGGPYFCASIVEKHQKLMPSASWPLVHAHPQTTRYVGSSCSCPNSKLANQAELAANKENVISGGRLESRQVFSTIPTLGELRYFLRVISNSLQQYQLWPVRLGSSLGSLHLLNFEPRRIVGSLCHYFNSTSERLGTGHLRLGFFRTLPSPGKSVRKLIPSSICYTTPLNLLMCVV